jgi:hypothetical protein
VPYFQALFLNRILALGFSSGLIRSQSPYCPSSIINGGSNKPAIVNVIETGKVTDYVYGGRDHHLTGHQLPRQRYSAIAGYLPAVQPGSGTGSRAIK